MYAVAVKIAGIHIVVQQLGLGLVALAHGVQTTLALQPLEHQTGQIPAVGWRRVKHGVGLGHGRIVHDGRGMRARLLEQVFTHYHYRQTGRADVFLGAGIDKAEFADIDGARQNGRRHVRDQRHIAGVGHKVILDAFHGFIRAVVYIGGGRVQVPLVGQGTRAVFGGGKTVQYPYLAHFFRFCHGGFGPLTGHDVIGFGILAHQVQRYSGKLATATALQKQHLVIVRHLHQVTQILLGLGRNGHIVGAAMAEFHHRHTQTVKIAKLGLSLLHDLNRQHGRTCAEVINHLLHFP